MSVESKGLRGIRTMAALLDNRRARTPAGALLELSAMANETLLLQKELARWTRRHAEIQSRLAEIAAKERRLLAYVQQPGPAAATAGPTVPPAASDTCLATTGVDVEAIAAASRNLRVKEFRY